jgi:mRNA interferase MazF
MSRLLRGAVVLADIGLAQGPKPVLVVSDNSRNRRLRSVLTVRLTTTANLPDIPSVVPVAATDHPLVGSVLCDDIIEVYDEDVIKDLGAVCPATMRLVEIGLRSALSL